MRCHRREDISSVKGAADVRQKEFFVPKLTNFSNRFNAKCPGEHPVIRTNKNESFSSYGDCSAFPADAGIHNCNVNRPRRKIRTSDGESESSSPDVLRRDFVG